MRRLRSIRRWMKYKYTLLLRAKGGASIVALGFSIGLAVEMFTLPTIGIAFFLIFPLVYFFRANLPAAIIGFAIGKIIYLFGMGAVNAWVGFSLLPNLHLDISFLSDRINRLLSFDIKLLVGGIIDGIILGALFYFPIRYSINTFKEKRREKRRLRRVVTKTKTNTTLD
jgi:uncharacterized protein (DUF2062 family)